MDKVYLHVRVRMLMGLVEGGPCEDLTIDCLTGAISIVCMACIPSQRVARGVKGR